MKNYNLFSVILCLLSISMHSMEIRTQMESVPMTSNSPLTPAYCFYLDVGLVEDCLNMGFSIMQLNQKYILGVGLSDSLVVVNEHVTPLLTVPELRAFSLANSESSIYYGLSIGPAENRFEGLNDHKTLGQYGCKISPTIGCFLGKELPLTSLIQLNLTSFYMPNAAEDFPRWIFRPSISISLGINTGAFKD